MNRIICIGNRLLDKDAAGPRVFDYLHTQRVPAGVEVVDGGIAGLNLLGLIDGCERVIFVDAVSGYAEPGSVVVLTPNQAPMPEVVYDHAAGLPYLFAVLPGVCDRVPDEICLVGIEGQADDRAIAEAARVATELAIRSISDNSARLSRRNHDSIR